MQEYDDTSSNYQRVEKAISFIRTHFKEQPSLAEIAATVNVSPHHFQKVFQQWAGISPKKFIQYISLEYTKDLLRQNNVSLLDAAHDVGLSGTGRLHDLFVNIESMTPGEFKTYGLGQVINYSFSQSSFGNILVASTTRGVCYIAFSDDDDGSLSDLKERFCNATFQRKADKYQEQAMFVFQNDWQRLDNVKLHLAGTPFQLKVWECLLKIPSGKVLSYSDVARSIHAPKAARAVGSAIACNPVAYLIPCHRVIKKDGLIGEYRWGETRKTAILGWEAETLETGLTK